MSVRYALLGLLAHHPSYGYELHDVFEAMVGGTQVWDIKPAQVYTTLSRLEEGGLVAVEAVQQEGGPEKRIFAITEAGRIELRDWLRRPVKSEHQRDEFFLKLMLCLATGEVSPRGLIYIQRASLYQELHDLTAQRSQTNPATDLAYILLMDQAAMHLEADLRWLEMIEARLEEVARQPLPEPETRPRGRPPKSD
jgi:DNA-binding PadR family transcriptional regulator